MRIVTRGDFDGLVSSVLLTMVESIREIRFVHPKDAQDGKVEADSEDIVVNLPYIENCGMWFDHHVSEEGKVPRIGEFKGLFKMAPSAARVIYDYYKETHGETLDRMNDLLIAADKLDAAQLTMEEVTNPDGWILLGLTLDPRSGLGPEFRKYFRWLVEYIKELPLEKVMAHPEVKKRTDRVKYEQDQFRDLLSRYTKLDGKIIVTDFRKLNEKPVGNRFIVYAMYPDAYAEVRLFNGINKTVVAAVGHSIFNRTCNVNVGNMLAEYGGGGHKGAGTAQLESEVAEQSIQEIIQRLQDNKE